MKDDVPDFSKLPPPPRDGQLGLATVFGALGLYILYLWATIGVGPPMAWANSVLAGPSALVPIAVYLGLAIVLAVEHRTSRTGAGLLIGLGIFTLLGGGLCVGSLVQVGI
jgi:hypothetical protein